MLPFLAVTLQERTNISRYMPPSQAIDDPLRVPVASFRNRPAICSLRGSLLRRPSSWGLLLLLEPPHSGDDEARRQNPEGRSCTRSVSAAGS